MKSLDEKMMQYLSFPDMQVEKMEFEPQNKRLDILVNGAFLDVNNIGILGRGVLHFNDWESISIRRFDPFSEEWLETDNVEPEELKDLCEVCFTSSDVSLCGFGKTIGNWLEWKIKNTKMRAEFRDKYEIDNDEVNVNRCRICGLYQEIPPWGEDGDSPTHNICNCCGVEAGHEDCSVKSCRAYRETWLSKGVRWTVPRSKPIRWSLNEQLKHIPSKYL